jgi:hypothetical protein
MPIEKPDVVDFVAQNPKTRDVLLVMIETRDWKNTPHAFQQLNAKFAGYAECILSGALVHQRPEFSNCSFRIQLDHFTEITPEVSVVLRQWAGKLSGIPVSVYSYRHYWNVFRMAFRKLMAKFRNPYHDAVRWEPEPGAASAPLTRAQCAEELQSKETDERS